MSSKIRIHVTRDKQGRPRITVRSFLVSNLLGFPLVLIASKKRKIVTESGEARRPAFHINIVEPVHTLEITCVGDVVSELAKEIGDPVAAIVGARIARREAGVLHLGLDDVMLRSEPMKETVRMTVAYGDKKKLLRAIAGIVHTVLEELRRKLLLGEKEHVSS